MNDQESQILAFSKKIHQQDETIDKLKAQQSKLTKYIKDFKESMEKKMTKQSTQNHNKTHAEEEKVQKQLEKELENAKTMLKNYQHQLKNLQKKSNKSSYTPQDLVNFDQDIRKKQNHLKQLNEDIKNLNIVKRKQEKLIEKKQKNQDGSKLSKLIEEVRKQKEILESLKIKHHQKQQILTKRKEHIKQVESKYLEKCQKSGQQPITFEDYKDRKAQKRRQESIPKSTIERKQQKKQISVRDMINAHLQLDNYQISQKSLVELRQKKNVAQNSLKIAKRKFQKQIEQLQEKVGELKKENDNLNTKYLEKRKQKQMIEASKTIDIKRNSSKTMKRLDPLK